MQFVFVVDSNKHPLDPVHPGRARHLLTSGQAAVFRRYPFSIILKLASNSEQVRPLRVKLDPGSKTTGIALVNDQSGQVVFAAELSHRGGAIKEALDTRRRVRRSRRQRHTRYRQPRHSNRRRKDGWLPPSLKSRVDNILTWVARLRRLAPVTEISMELVRFDMRAMEQPDIVGVQYQQGTLAGYELREFLLEKWGRACAYCAKQGVPLQVEHIVARARGGTDRVSNLTLSCKQCNQDKGSQDIAVFLKNKPEVLKHILAKAKAPMKDAAAVNTTRWRLLKELKATGLPVECGSGGLTKYNRSIRGLEKAHWLDAANVGCSTPQCLQIEQITPLEIKATGWQRRQLCLVDAYGFPRTRPKKHGTKHTFHTGDIVRAAIPAHLKNAGVHVGRMAAKASGSFTISTRTRTVKDVNHRYCRCLHKKDGYGYYL